MSKEIEPISLFDMDGTLCDHDKDLLSSLNHLRSPSEEEIVSLRDIPEYVRKRADLIRSSGDWWENLPKFQLGWDILNVARKLNYRLMILTQGPSDKPDSWSGKKRWIDEHLGQDTDITITRDKGLVYGKILVDDYPKYAERWLDWRERGLVIMPANPDNKDFVHERVIRYDGSNIEEVERAMIIARNRGKGEPLVL